jgi:hypothetical protein
VKYSYHKTAENKPERKKERRKKKKGKKKKKETWHEVDSDKPRAYTREIYIHINPKRSITEPSVS